MTRNEIFQYLYDISLPHMTNAVLELNNADWRGRTYVMYEEHLTRLVRPDGIYDFRPVVDETNNTPTDIDNNHKHVCLFLKMRTATGYTEVQIDQDEKGMHFSVWDIDPLNLMRRTPVEFIPNGPARP